MDQGPNVPRRRRAAGGYQEQEERVRVSRRTGRPYREALGRTEELQEKQRERTRSAELYAAEDDIYDPRSRQMIPARKPKKSSHRGFWAFVILLCTVCLLTIGLLVAPQLLGVRFSVVPNYAFVNGSILTYDRENETAFHSNQQYLAADVVYPGVFVDGLSVGGMTVEEARSMLAGVPAVGGGEFAISVTVDGSTWLIDSGKVPMTRNLEEMLDLAWSYGRQNTAAIRGTRVTPFQERLNTAAAMREQPVNLATYLAYDKASIRQLAEGIAAAVNIAPVDATVAAFDFDNKNFYFNSDVSGRYVSADEIYTKVMERLTSGDWYAALSFQSEEVLAGVTKAELMNSFCRISSFTTKTTDNKNRNTNVQLSAQAINGMVVLPGETFSFNAATGERTSDKGYKPAAAISGGQLNDEVGGGVCQTSSTLFNAVVRANLEIVSRSPHAWPSSYVPEGMDATVNWPGLDFKFRNNTNYPIYIVAWYENRRVTAELYGMGLGDGVTIDLEHKKVRDLLAPAEIKEVQNTRLPLGTRQKTVSKRDGSVWETYQVWMKNGQEIKRELLCTSTYKAYQETIEYN